MSLGGCAAPILSGGHTTERLGPNDRARFLAPFRARADRIFDITVCLRPFRAAGPRLDTERIRDTLVVHNYGHGGSGWSLSWGSSTIARWARRWRNLPIASRSWDAGRWA